MQWDKAIVVLRPDEYAVEKISYVRENTRWRLDTPQTSYTLSPYLLKLIHSVDLEWELNLIGNRPCLVMATPNRNSRYVIQKLRRYPAMLTCEFSKGKEMIEYLRENATGEFQPAGVFSSFNRGAIYCRNIEDAMLAKMRFNNIEVRELNPGSIDGELRDVVLNELDDALGDYIRK